MSAARALLGALMLLSCSEVTLADMEMEHDLPSKPSLLAVNRATMHEMVKSGATRVDLKKAVKRIERKLPRDVVRLVHNRAAGKARGQPVAESSLQKARVVLNQMIFKAWEELDAKTVECNAYFDSMEESYTATANDLNRLAAEMADLKGLNGEAIDGGAAVDYQIQEARNRLGSERQIYTTTKLKNMQQMTIRRSDMAVFQFMMKLTKCPKETSFAQQGDGAQGSQAKICSSDKKGLYLDFGDKKMQAKLDRMMTPSARRAVHQLLDSMQVAQVSQAVTAPSFLQTKQEPGEEPTHCTLSPPDCGLLHDKMSLMWGQYKDLVDELQQEMDKNEFEWEELQEQIEAELEALRARRAAFTQQLAEVTSNQNSGVEQKSLKTTELNDIIDDYHLMQKKCDKRIRWIMYQDLCSFVSIRAEVLKDSEKSPPEMIDDCTVSDWVPGDCSVSCDDDCPHTDPFSCGGWQLVTRTIIQENNQFGVQCPFQSTRRKCKQVKCPVDCKMSKWSPFSSCSAECDGGVESRSRSVLVQANHGGEGCGQASDARPCNSYSCDADCKLKRWSRWSPCSAACGTGFSEKWKRVLVLQKGNGECPTATSTKRYRTKECNTFACTGDEICIARQDLVLSIDGSGSLTQSGFDAFKAFAASLTDKYMAKYHGSEDMRIGVVQFGNGEVLDDNSVAKAKLIIGLTNDIAGVKKAIEGMKFMRGFTNMAQAFTKAETLFLLGGRRDAQSAVMTLTDGKPSFLFQTYETVMQLKDKHVKLFFVPIQEGQDTEALTLMKKWASSPWFTHLVSIPGVEMLQSDMEVFKQKIVVEFCPNAISPSSDATEEQESGYMYVAESKYCGAKKRTLYSRRNTQGAEGCFALAQGKGLSAFLMGKRFARKVCMGLDFQPTQAYVTALKNNKADPPVCPGGSWKRSKMYDMYIVVPVAM